MLKVMTPDSQIDDYIKSIDPLYVKAKSVLAGLENALLSRNPMVTNKNIISVLVDMLEVERDPTTLDIYRLALQIIVEQTPDDTFQ